MCRRRLSDLALTQSGGESGCHVFKRKCDHFFGNKKTLCYHNLLTATGRALCNGTKTNFHEAKTWKLLHAGEGLLQNPLSWVLHLPSSWFWMVRWDSHTICLSSSFFFFCSYWLVISLHYMIERMKRLKTTQQKAVQVQNSWRSVNCEIK